MKEYDTSRRCATALKTATIHGSSLYLNTGSNLMRMKCTGIRHSCTYTYTNVHAHQCNGLSLSANMNVLRVSVGFFLCIRMDENIRAGTLHWNLSNMTVLLRYFLSHSFFSVPFSSFSLILYSVYLSWLLPSTSCRSPSFLFRINAMWCSTSFVVVAVVVVDFSPALYVTCVYVWSWVERKFSQNRISSLLTFENINRIAVQQDNKRLKFCEQLM